MDSLEDEIGRYRDKISDTHFYKSRAEELRDDNAMLQETKHMLDQQLCAARKRGEQVGIRTGMKKRNLLANIL